jgi:hypothetical protein
MLHNFDSEQKEKCTNSIVDCRFAFGGNYERKQGVPNATCGSILKQSPAEARPGSLETLKP